jgi:hypothetical protein
MGCSASIKLERPQMDDFRTFPSDRNGTELAIKSGLQTLGGCISE